MGLSNVTYLNVGLSSPPPGRVEPVSWTLFGVNPGGLGGKPRLTLQNG